MINQFQENLIVLQEEWNIGEDEETRTEWLDLEHFLEIDKDHALSKLENKKSNDNQRNYRLVKRIVTYTEYILPT